MIPTLAQIVYYTLSEHEAHEVNRRRQDAWAKIEYHRTEKTGVQVHVGNAAHEGDVFPMLIVKTFNPVDGGPVNGQVFLDGNDTLWVTSRVEGTTPGTWCRPPHLA